MKKAQGTHEFFMTFGWMILFLVVFALCAIALGLVDISKWIPVKCQLDKNFECKDYKIAENAILMQLQNNIGYTVHVYELKYTLNDGTICSWSGDFLMANEDVHTYATVCSIGNGTAVQRIQMEMHYFKTANAMHTVTGEMVGKVKGSYSFDFQSEGVDVCSSAQLTGICNGLDALFGTGTKQRCQDDYGLCL